MSDLDLTPSAPGVSSPTRGGTDRAERWFVARFIAGRLLFAAAATSLVVVIVFFCMRLTPGDPARLILGINGTPEQEKALTEALGLDESVFVQFGIWLRDALGGDLGYSYTAGRPVLSMVTEALGNTLQLALLATFFVIVVGVALGNLGLASKRVVRSVAQSVELALISIPQYTAAILLLVVFTVVFRVFPSGGRDPDPNAGFIAQLPYLLLPAIALSLSSAAQLARTLRTSLESIRQTDLPGSFRGRGLGPGRIAWHLHRNVMASLVVVLAIQFGVMIGGAVFVESIFSIPGLGTLLIGSIGGRDYQTVQGASIALALISIIALFLADLVRLLIDPRQRRATA